MRAELYRPDAPKKVVGSATWSRRGVGVKAEGEAEATIRRIFRPIPLVVDDPAMRPAGTSGTVVLNPGTLLWFRAAGQVRAKEEGLAVRLVPEGQGVMGWDPAGAYRTFSESVERKQLSGVAARTGEPEPGEERAEGIRGPSAPGTEAAAPAAPPSAAGHRDPAG